jgi:hypothetical protein
MNERVIRHFQYSLRVMALLTRHGQIRWPLRQHEGTGFLRLSGYKLVYMMFLRSPLRLGLYDWTLHAA